MKQLAPLERLGFWFRGQFLGRPLTEIEHALLTRAHWHATNDEPKPWKASVRSEDWVLAVGPSRRELILSIGGREIGATTEWSREWTLPGQEPTALEVVAMIAGIARPGMR